MIKHKNKTSQYLASGTTSQELFPNCSEICWRLEFQDNRTTKEKICDILAETKKRKGSKCETDTASFPNGCLDNMIYLIKDAQKKKKSSLNDMRAEYIENEGGGGNWNYVDKCFDIAMKYCKGEITKNKAEKLDQDLWENGGDGE